MGLFGVPCAGCARQLRIDADACWGCGRAVTDAERAVEHARRVRRGRRWLGLSAILVVLSGFLELSEQKSTADRIIVGIESRAVDGASAPPGSELSALRDRLARRRARSLGVNVGLAAVFGVLWLLARRAPVAAFASAIAVLLGVWIVSALVDRSTLLDSYVIRVAALVVIGAGLRAALAARRATTVR
jgi:hypothetical protein